MSRIVASGPKLELKPFGDWVGVAKDFKSIAPKLKVAVLEAQIKVAIKVLKKVQSHLVNQDLNWEPLGHKYKSLKAAKGVDTRILLARWTYFKNIRYWHRKNGWEVFIGVKKGVYGRRPDGNKNKLDVATIAAIHEFHGKVKRPLWGPTIRELGGKAGIRKMYIDEIEKSLRKTRLSKYLTRLKRR